MAKIKVLDLAKEAGMEDDKLLRKLKGMGVKVKEKKPAEPEKKVSSSEERVIERDANKEIVERRIKPTVIRRRTRSLEPKVEAPPAIEAETVLPPGAPVEQITEERAPQPTKEKGTPAIRRKVGERPREGIGVEEAEDEEAARVMVLQRGKKEAGAAEPEEGRPEKRRAVPAGPGVEEEIPAVAARSKEGAQAAKLPEDVTPAKAQPKGPPKPLEVKFPESIAVPEREETVPPGKKKTLGKKRRVVEERIFEREPLEEEEPAEPSPLQEVARRSFRPARKRVVVSKGHKKTEVTVPKPIKRIIRIAEVITVGDLSKRMGVKSNEVIKKLMEIGVMVTINQVINADVASLVANEFGYEIEKVSLERQDLLERKEDLPEQLKPRPPVVTVMGHVDHGKTMLLDAIRKTNVVDGEAGGITQHIGAYDVELENGRVAFVDTPGHEAFTAMRARGAQVTDVVILVVAADDGVMPQTKEAIDHARAAKVPIVVAINKIDKPAANPEKVKKDLSDLGLVPESWGGSTLYGEVSAKQKKGIKELLELILLQAEILELKANPDKPARGTIIEAKLDKGRGPVATVLVQEGSLRAGDIFIAGSHYGRVRAMYSDRGLKIDTAGPSTPAEVLGFSDVPEAGETFIVTREERVAKQISLYRQEKIREKELAKLSKVSLEELYEQIKKGEVKELNVILKADVQGSIEAIKEALRRISTEAVKVSILHEAVGGITETDVNLAAASNAVIIGFNVRPTPQAQSLAEETKVDVRLYSIIYEALSDIKKALEGLLEPTYKEHILGRAQVLQLFNIRKVGLIAGSLVLDGKVVKGSHARLLRDNVVIYDGRITSLRRFKDDAKDCGQGLECGIWIENFSDVKPGDIIESYEVEEIQPHLA